MTRERLYIETLESVLANSTKVIVDTDGGNNMLYLPLDQLMQRRSNASTSEPASAAPVPMTNNVAPRSRDREGR